MRALILCAAALIVGCSFSTLTTASNLDPGETQLLIAPGYTRYKRGSGEPLYAPQLEIGGRYGLTKRLELGGKLWLPGIQIDAKYALMGYEEGAGFHLALDPTFGYMGGFEGTATGEGNTLEIITLSVPVLMGWRFGTDELIVAPRVVDQIWTGTGASTMTANIASAGASLGYSWRVAPGVRIIPEVSWGFIFAQTLFEFGSSVGANGTMAQINLGLLFGGDEIEARQAICVDAPASAPSVAAPSAPDRP
ncbi:hypothetical protein KKF91_02595 [Myxococcota bacterium]|nr:hypothetical protein [Myxococcota bacterium]